MSFVQQFQACLGAGWTPRIGDPYATGWLTVAAYVLCMVLAIAVLRRRPAVSGRGFWLLIAMLMAVLAVNKQLDLQTALTATGRCLAKAQGWYDGRGVVQMVFIMTLLLVAGFGLMAAIVALRRSLRQNMLALIGVTILCAFVLVRAAGFHHVDRLIGQDFAHIRVNFLFENAGLLLIALNAVLLLRAGRGRRRRTTPA